MPFQDHVRRIAYLMIGVTALFAWRVSRAEVLSADGLRYISQAQKIAAGNWQDGLSKAVDHPMYPIQIAGLWTLIGMPDTPVGWQNAAWAASFIHGVLLVIPLYWISRNLFGDQTAWLGVVAFFAVPHTSQIMADALSESTFLNFWCWSLGFALAFLQKGHPGWLIGTATTAALAYWTRPEGLLICLSLGLTILLTPMLPSTRIDWPRFGRVIALLGMTTALFALPVILSRGSIGTKPAIAKVLGLQQRARAHAVEREKPLPPDQSELQTWAQAVAAVYRATKDATTTPGLFLGLAGLAFWSSRNAADARKKRLVQMILLPTILALVRLHATQGYCAPRHTMVMAMILLLAASNALYKAVHATVGILAGQWKLGELQKALACTAVWSTIGLGWFASQANAFMIPIGHEVKGYREAGQFLASHTQPGEPIVDLAGWSSYYAGRPGYGFAKMHLISPTVDSNYIVVREAHLIGPWDYCELMRKMTADAKLVAEFPRQKKGRQSRVLVFERTSPLAHHEKSHASK